MISLTRITIFALSVWLIFTIYASLVLFRYQYQQNSGYEELYPTKDEHGTILLRLNKALRDIEKLREQNEDLKLAVNEKLDKIIAYNKSIAASKERNIILAPGQKSSPISETLVCPPPSNFGHLSLDHEEIRRSLENGLKEFWFMLNNKLRKLPKNQSNLAQKLDKLLKNQLYEQFLILYTDSLKLAEVDGATLHQKNELLELSSIVQKRLNTLQNPKNCKNAKKVLCTLNKGCGFGCQIHHVTYCFIASYALNRTLILVSDNWRYSKDGWESVFRPISETCTQKEGGLENAVPWEGYDKHQNHDVISMPIIDGLQPRLKELPLSFPKEFAQKLLRLHGNPPAWWIAQFLKYLWRYQPDLHKKIDNLTLKLNYTNPLVGVHVRRTDKVGTEAAFHSIDEYMTHVEHWFKVQEVKLMTSLKPGENKPVSLKRRIYLATDEPSVIDEARNKYKNYEVIADKNIAVTAGMANRFSDDSLIGVILDIHFLAQSDFLVCTFSSQVCRLAFELMQFRRGDDSSSNFKSLDDIFYFGGQLGHRQVAFLDHHVTSDPSNSDQSVEGEIELKVGDVISVMGNHWDGYSKGRNHRTGHVGLYPSYKVKEAWRIEKFPEW